MMAGELIRMRKALSFVEPDDRATWVRMAMAVKSEAGEAGFDLWDTWSQAADTYNAADARDVWKSIKGDGKVTAGTLYHAAKAHGWRDDGTWTRPTPQELEARRREAEARAAADAAQIERERTEAADNAAAIWKISIPAGGNPYLERKGAGSADTLRQIDAEAAEKVLGYPPQSRGEPLRGRLLVVPVKIGERLSTLELIDKDGRKTALRGRTTKAGGFWAAQPLPENDGAGLTLLIGEGVATSLSAREATGYPAVAALSANNLAAVAHTMRNRYPAARLVLLADLVKATGEPDRHAIEAAEAVGGRLAVPDFRP